MQRSVSKGPGDCSMCVRLRSQVVTPRSSDLFVYGHDAELRGLAGVESLAECLIEILLALAFEFRCERLQLAFVHPDCEGHFAIAHLAGHREGEKWNLWQPCARVRRTISPA